MIIGWLKRLFLMVVILLVASSVLLTGCSDSAVSRITYNCYPLARCQYN